MRRANAVVHAISEEAKAFYLALGLSDVRTALS
jgi:hypothetical protein